MEIKPPAKGMRRFLWGSTGLPPHLRIGRLERKVADLEGRLAALESRTAGARTTRPDDP